MSRARISIGPALSATVVPPSFPIMPGLPSHPAAMDIDVDERTGLTKGLF